MLIFIRNVRCVQVLNCVCLAFSSKIPRTLPLLKYSRILVWRMCICVTRECVYVSSTRMCGNATLKLYSNQITFGESGKYGKSCRIFSLSRSCRFFFFFFYIRLLYSINVIHFDCTILWLSQYITETFFVRSARRACYAHLNYVYMLTFKSTECVALCFNRMV